MKKESIKVKRLSPKVRNLIDSARNKYSTQPEKAIKYLQSISPSDLNMYDRQKVGREILSRVDLGGDYIEGQKSFLFRQKVADEYGVNYHSRDSRKSFKKGEDRGLGEVWYALRDAKEGNKHLEIAMKARKKKNFQAASQNYSIAGQMFRDAGLYDKAMLAYETGAEMNKLDPEFTVFVEPIKEVREKINELREQKKSSESKRRSALENAVGVIMIIGFLGSIFFLSSNITGNAVANLSLNTTSWIGGVLLVVGLVAGLFWMKSKKEKPISKKRK
jgi:tetratricopeptide (TPR) repeat protein